MCWSAIVVIALDLNGDIMKIRLIKVILIWLKICYRTGKQYHNGTTHLCVSYFWRDERFGSVCHRILWYYVGFETQNVLDKFWEYLNFVLIVWQTVHDYMLLYYQWNNVFCAWNFWVDVSQLAIKFAILSLSFNLNEQSGKYNINF